ncbi:MAG: ATP-binding cassette domain-containing protein [Nitrospinaceae bacterium]|nr:ABC transporter ATP-binding protein [Nitrospinaceae bacterium]NIR57736.1 ABC transporter ATP-binding protein [Nitrospinaceae bacterium]NIS88196.1 ABC transporter ATP-binding protein [Nitrospinaceae bacterium]NIT85080.1 ABC transporter ATP-binding protein [Nitrospinaceae bacterium]NIU47234.1 ABC transporter ATP-binding protein [Nitrospinaceae bacterium]
MKRIQTFIPYLLAYRWEISIGIIALLATDVIGLVIPWLLKSFIDLLPQKPAGSELGLYAGLLFLAAVGQGVSRFGWRKYLFGPSRKIEVDILNKLYAHLQTLDKTFFQGWKVGDLMSRATNDLRAVKDFLGLGLLVVLDAVVVIIACIGLMLYINPRLTLFALLPLPLVSILFFGFIRTISVRHKAIQEHLAKITAMVQENLAGIRVLHAFVQEAHEIKRFDGLNREYVGKNMGLAKLFGMFTPSLVLTIGVASMISLWLGGKEVIAGNMTLGSFVAFNGYLLMLSWPMMAIGYVINLTQKGLAAMGRIQEIFDSKSDLLTEEGTDEMDSIRGEIELREVSFAYPGGEKPVLEEVSFKVEPGRTVAIIGMIGAGKSSIAQLIPRVFDLPNGNLLIDGKPVSGFPLDRLRRQIGFVDQEPFLFSTSIRNNIAMGREGVTEDEIQEMVRCVHLIPDLERWPKGLDTIVGERGVSLSGGQKQRIALARTLIRKPKILILDDAFSNLDMETESIILRNIEEILQTMTTLIITHRLAIARKASQILVMDQGRIVERGRHEDLMKQEGWYRRMYTNQALAQEMEILLQ